MARYVLIGLERSDEYTLRNKADESNVPAHLLIKEPYDFCGEIRYVYRKRRYDQRHDTISIADIESISNNRVRVVKLPLNKLMDFEQQYNVKVFCPNNMDKYGSTNVQGNQPMIIISKIGNIGCQCVDVQGNIINLRNSDVLKYANTWGIANAKVYEKMNLKSDSLIISGIGWTIPTISVEQAKDTPNRKVNRDKAADTYVAKASLVGAKDFEIDTVTSTLVRCNTRKFDKLTIPPVKVIGYDAFDRIEANEIIIPETVKVIGARAFDCVKAITLTFKGSVDKVAKDAFKFSSLKVVNLGMQDSDDIGLKDGEFKNIFIQDDLEEISVSQDNKNYTSKDGILYSKDMRRLIAYPRSHKNLEYIMPSTVEETCGFLYVKNIKRLVLSDKLEYLDTNTSIHDCEDLEIIELGKSFKEIRNYAIEYNKNLRKIIKRSNVKIDNMGIRPSFKVEIIDRDPDNRPSQKTIEAKKQLEAYCKRQGWI